MKFKIFICALITGLSLISCHGDLNVIQTSEVSAPSMWQEEGDAKSAMYGLFNIFRSTMSAKLMYWGEYRTGLWADGLAGQTARDQVYQNRLTPDHGQTDWIDLYTTINSANLILKYTPGISFNSEDDQKNILANAYFVRAFCYYWIGRVWGDAPVLLDGFESDKQEGLFPKRDPAETVFKQVADDLDNALKLMPTSITARNLASPGNINMLKADYNLWMYKVRNGGQTALDAAATAIAAVLGNTNYSLEDDFANVFDNELGEEIIFAWSYIENEYTGGSPADWLVPSQYVSEEYINNPVKVGTHQQWCFYTEDYKTFLSENPEDQRTIVSFETFYDDLKKSSFQWINKFDGTWVNGTRIFDADVIVYRYADAILMDAEIRNAKNDRSGAITSLNRIAKRAYKVDNFYPATLTTVEVDNAILDERLKEFPAEGKLWWDYIRFGVAFERNQYLKGRENELNVLLWPVSAASINKNQNIVQTPGYDK